MTLASGFFANDRGGRLPSHYGINPVCLKLGLCQRSVSIDNVNVFP